jgi:hypothetical protein
MRLERRLGLDHPGLVSCAKVRGLDFALLWWETVELYVGE